MEDKLLFYIHLIERIQNFFTLFNKVKIVRFFLTYVPENIKNIIYYTPIRTKYSGNPNEPWFTRDAITILKGLIKRDFIGFEFGTGGSTIWVSKRINHLISIEHSSYWYYKLKNKIKKKKLHNVDLYFVPRTNNKYANFITKFPDNYFDLILIDGRDRVECIKNSIKKLKLNGILVLDNSEREKYREGKILLSDWKEIETFNGKWKTTIWIKK
ncbi:MAG: hypothetical protein ACTSPW_17170 [Promethearchaeota archaeon]